MEVDSPTQHSPIYVDVQSNYRVTFDNMKYAPVTSKFLLPFINLMLF